MKFELQEKSDGTLTQVTYSNINHAAGTITFNPDVVTPLPKPNFTYVDGETGDGKQVKTGYFQSVSYVNYPTVYTDGAVEVTYATSNTATTKTVTFQNNAETVDLPISLAGGLIESSIQIESNLGNSLIKDNKLYTYNSGASLALVERGTFNPETGEIIKSTTTPGNISNVKLKGACEYLASNSAASASFIIPQAPILPSSVIVSAKNLNGETFTATCDNNGKIDAPFIYGKADLDSGYCDVKFGNWVTVSPSIEALSYYDPALVVGGKFFVNDQADATSITFSAVGTKFVPINTAIVGADVRRLPTDGKVPIYQVGDTGVMIYETTTGGTYTSSQTVFVGRTSVSRITAYDNLGLELPSAAVEGVNLLSGTIKFADLTGVSQPIQIVARDESTHTIVDVDISGIIGLSPQLPKAFPAGSLLCNALLMGNLFANVSLFFTQQSWLNHWFDYREGNTIVAAPNFTNYPIVLNNYDSIEEKWAIIISGSSTTCNVIGESVGQVLTNVPINQAIAPINPATGNPYFTIPATAMGGGWSIGNVLRFNTKDASKGIAVIKSVSQGTRQSDDYKFCIETRIDVNS